MLPGERNEIVVDCTDGQPARLVSSPGSERGDRGNPNGSVDAFEVVTLQPDPRLPAAL